MGSSLADIYLDTLGGFTPSTSVSTHFYFCNFSNKHIFLKLSMLDFYFSSFLDLQILNSLDLYLL